MPLYGTQRQFAEDPINKCETDISKKLQRSVSHVQSGQQPSSDDYKAIVAFDKARDSLLNKPEYRAFANCISSLNTNCFDPRLCTLL